MTTFRNVTATVLAAYVSIAAVNAYAFGLGDVTGAASSVTGGGSSDSSAKVDIGALTTKGKGLLGKFTSAYINMLQAQKNTAAALGLKKESDDAEAGIKFLGSGNIDSDELKRNIALTEDNNKTIEKKMDEKAPLDAAAKKSLASAVPHYVKAIAETAGLPNEFKNYAQSVSQGVTGLASNPMNAAKLKDGTAAPITVATNLPDLLSNFGTTTKAFVSFAQSNDVSTGDLDKKIGGLED